MKVHKIHYGPRDNPKVIEQEYLEPHELVPGGLYKIVARNASFGIWTPEYRGFHISRTKFGRNYLFVEIHWDLSDGFGTVRPLKFVELAPFNYTELKDWHTPDRLEKEVLSYLNEFEVAFEKEMGVYRGP